MGKLPDWLKRIRMRLHSLRKRLQSRRQRCRNDSKANADPLHLVCLRDRIGSPTEMTRKDVTAEWKKLCRSRSIPIPEKGKAPILREVDQKVRDAGIRWYTGSFPGDPDVLKHVLGAATYKQHKSRVDNGMGLDVWGESARKRTTQSIKALVQAIEKYWEMGNGKRKRIESDMEDEEWKPKRTRRSFSASIREQGRLINSICIRL